MTKDIESFEDLHIWKEGMQLATELYEELKDCKDFGMKDQIQRSAVSIPLNIAEGFERNTNKNFIRFLFISKSSAAELRTQLYLCRKTGLIPKQKCDTLIDKAKKISGMIHNLIKTRREKFS